MSKDNIEKRRRILVTGGCGFIGSNFIRHMLKTHRDVEIINLDALTYAGNLENLADFSKSPRYTFVHGNITCSQDVERAITGVEWVVHFAAESHVDRSILNAIPFIETNVNGTLIMLEVARRNGVKRFIHVSTDEVYGSAPMDAFFLESAPLSPSSPYSASKASSDLLVLSYYKTFDFPAIVVRSTNNYGPYQFPEKVIPLFLTNALENKSLPLYGNGSQIRDWLYVEDNCRAIETVLYGGTVGEIYNIGVGKDTSNIVLTKQLLSILSKPESLIQFVKDRPGHDLRYAVDTSKIRTLGWKPTVDLEDGLAATINWYQQNQIWWQNIKSGEYQSFYQKLYGGYQAPEK